ncbi:MAG: hypothetical protein J5896_01330 [Alphaproteobacteria bacterium]|nr:hypothetical protein [Alphaproteobacteria bacterium]
MRKLVILAVCLSVFALSACTGARGTIGGQKVCTNDYLLGVLSISELVSPCNK